jgi:hypothetical protein
MVGPFQWAASVSSSAQLGQHLCRGRTHAAPERKGLGGLLHQHAQAITRQRAMAAGPVQKILGGGAVHHVVGQTACVQHAGGRGHIGPSQAAGCGVDDDVEILGQISLKHLPFKCYQLYVM